MAVLRGFCKFICCFDTFVKTRPYVSLALRLNAGAPFIRQLSSNSALKVDKQLLTKLRKQTGFGFSKCHEALAQHDNSYDLAEAWLHKQAQKEGWTKATKLQGRSAEEGLIGIIVKDNFAAMVEVNCETDFVARNENFQALVADITNVALERRKSILEQSLKLNAFGKESNVHLRETMPEHKLRNVRLADTSSETVADAIVRVIGKLGENIKVGRAVTMTTEEDCVTGCYVHGPFTASVNNCIMGKFGTVVSIKASGTDMKETDLIGLARKLSQHVTGMNPKVISADVGSDIVKADKETTDILVEQEFLLDNSVTVGELLEREGVIVTDFVRLECGGGQ